MPQRNDLRRFVLVAFHAHPDDEALLTGGTLARVSAEGHRVVVVVATDGGAGLAAGEPGAALADRRARELQDSADTLGVARVVRLRHRDSGWLDAPGTLSSLGAQSEPLFSHLPVEDVAHELAALLRAERADALTIYDRAGGYGHPDHVHVHRCGVRAAELAGTSLVLEATLDRTPVRRALRIVGLLPGFVGNVTADRVRDGFSARRDLTHQVDVRTHVRAKQAALRAHASQGETRGRWGLRGVGLLGALPGPLARRVLGAEWFIERGRVGGGPLLDDVFTSLR